MSAWASIEPDTVLAKDRRQIRRDHRLVLSLIMPPVIQLLVFGLALDPK